MRLMLGETDADDDLDYTDVDKNKGDEKDEVTFLTCRARATPRSPTFSVLKQ